MARTNFGQPPVHVARDELCKPQVQLAEHSADQTFVAAPLVV
jgi:hypothetical protein